MPPGQAFLTDFFKPKNAENEGDGESRKRASPAESPNGAKKVKTEPRSDNPPEQRPQAKVGMPTQNFKKSPGVTRASTNSASQYRYQVKQEQEVASTDDQTDPRKQDLHERFVNFLGQPGGLQRFRRRVVSPEAAGDDDDDDEGDEDPKTTKATKKLTPFEEQYIELKRKYMDTILIVHNGYKYKIYGQDARVVSRICSYALIPGKMTIDDSDPNDKYYNRFASCSFPVYQKTLETRVKQLVSAGYKVGIVNQTETAAIKKADKARKSKLFAREVTSMHTMGTLLDDFENASAGVLGSTSGHLMALVEIPGGANAPSGSRTFAFMAVQTSSGEIIYDEFKDTALLTDLETRLLHIQPSQIVRVGETSSETDRLLSHLRTGGVSVQLDRVDTVSLDDAPSFLADYFANLIQDNKPGLSPQILDVVGALQPGVKAAFWALLQYLIPFKLENALELVGNFMPFGSRSHMTLNGNTLMSLEIFQNQTDQTDKGTLFKFIDNTRTQFGRRLLRKWVANPLVDREAIELRLDAAAELFRSFNKIVEPVIHGFSNSPDLENGLIRVKYKRIDRKQLYYLLYYLHRFSASIEEEHVTTFSSPILREHFMALPKPRKLLSSLLARVSANAARQNAKVDYFILDESPDHEDVADLKMVSAR